MLGEDVGDVVVGFLAGDVDGDAADELALEVVEEVDALDVEAEVLAGEAALPCTGQDDRGAGDAIVVEVDECLSEEHELMTAAVVLELQAAILATVFGRACLEVDHHAADGDLVVLDGGSLVEGLEVHRAAIVELHEVGVEGMGREVHADEVALLLKPDGVDPHRRGGDGGASGL